MFQKVNFLWKIAYKGRGFYGAFVSMLWGLHALFHFLLVIVLQQAYDIYLEKGYTRVFLFALLRLGAVLLLDQVFMTMSNAVCENSSYLMMKGFGSELQRVVSLKKPIEFEKSEFQDALTRADEGVENATYFLNVVQSVFCFQIPFLILTVCYLLKHSLFLPLAFALICIPGGISRMRKAKIYDVIQGKLAGLEREVNVYNEAVCGTGMFRESRFWGAGDWFKTLVERVVTEICENKEKTANKAKNLSLIYHMISALGVLMALMILIHSFANGKMTVGVLAAIVTSVITVLELLENLVGYYWGQLAEQSGNVDYLIGFLRLSSDDDGDEKLLAKDEPYDGIVLSDISFQYPGSSEKALQGIDFVSEKKEIIAIVGENGAGKSTLMKIIAGLYQPLSGKYYHNTVQKVSFVFQDFQRYALSLKDNICFGKEISSEELDNLLKKSGIESLPKALEKGVDTFLSKEYDGTDLSGGQWQRVAIARGLFGDSDCLILDEPTAAIDPMEETRLYELFLEICEGKRAFIVTHRLGICKHVDRILVLKNGRLVEDGSHEELIKKEGEYKRLYDSQAGLYVSMMKEPLLTK